MYDSNGNPKTEYTMALTAIQQIQDVINRKPLPIHSSEGWGRERFQVLLQNHNGNSGRPSEDSKKWILKFSWKCKASRLFLLNTSSNLQLPITYSKGPHDTWFHNLLFWQCQGRVLTGVKLIHCRVGGTMQQGAGWPINLWQRWSNLSVEGKMRSFSK